MGGGWSPPDAPRRDWLQRSLCQLLPKLYPASRVLSILLEKLIILGGSKGLCSQGTKVVENPEYHYWLWDCGGRHVSSFTHIYWGGHVLSFIHIIYWLRDCGTAVATVFRLSLISYILTVGLRWQAFSLFHSYVHIQHDCATAVAGMFHLSLIIPQLLDCGGTKAILICHSPIYIILWLRDRGPWFFVPNAFWVAWYCKVTRWSLKSESCICVILHSRTLKNPHLRVSSTKRSATTIHSHQRTIHQRKQVLVELAWSWTCHPCNLWLGYQARCRNTDGLHLKDAEILECGIKVTTEDFP